MGAGQGAAFLGVSLLVIVTPGQDTALTIRNTLAGGRRSAGLAALLLASQPAFTALRLAGAAYLVVLGLQALVSAMRSTPPAKVRLELRTRVRCNSSCNESPPGRRHAGGGFLCRHGRGGRRARRAGAAASPARPGRDVAVARPSLRPARHLARPARAADAQDASRPQAGARAVPEWLELLAGPQPARLRQPGRGLQRQPRRAPNRRSGDARDGSRRAAGHERVRGGDPLGRPRSPAGRRSKLVAGG